MKQLNPLYLFLLLAWLGTSCSPGNLSYTEAQERNYKKLDTEAQRKDAEFLVEAANYNLLFNSLSSRAVERGYARFVVDFAQASLADHQRMQDDIKKLAKEEKIAIPSTMSERFQQTINELATTDQRSFDKIYLNTVESVHERAIRLFEDAALNANNSDVRAFAAAKLDVIRSHSRRADELENRLL